MEHKERADTLLSVKDLKVYFDWGINLVKAVDGVSLKVDKGKIVALVGESGSGKSTVAMGIVGLLDRPGKIVGGEIMLAGQNVRSLSPTAHRNMLGQQVGIIFQDLFDALNPRMRIGAMVTEAVQVGRRLSKKAAVEASLDLLQKMRLPDPSGLMHKYPYQLSGGMCQRVMIAIAMALKPPLLIADEPTTALDVTVQAGILEEILRLKQEYDTGILFITHDLGVVAEIADDLYIMKEGKIIESGPVAHIFDHPAHMYTKSLLQSIL